MQINLASTDGQTSMTKDPLLGYPDSIQEIIARGDRRESLTAIRDYLADLLIDDVPEYTVVKITQQLINIIRELDELPKEEARSAIDEVKRKREERRAAAALAGSGQADDAASAGM